MTKQEIMENLEELPDQLIEKAYALDVILRTLQLQYDSFLKGLYKAERIPDKPGNPMFIYFRIGKWRVIMETEED